MDVSTADTITIVTKDIVKVPLEARGPIGRGLSALLIGRSSSTLNGLIVHVGVIDADFTGQICALVSTLYPPVTIPKGTRLAQLVPFLSCVPKAEQRLRGDGGFGSTGPPQVCWSQTVSSSRPHMTCTLSNHGHSPTTVRLAGLLDTGADVTIISNYLWPSTWPTEDVDTGVVGLGGSARARTAATAILITNPEGQQAVVKPYVTAAPLNLWGRDCLSQWGVKITTDF